MLNYSENETDKKLKEIVSMFELSCDSYESVYPDGFPRESPALAHLQVLEAARRAVKSGNTKTERLTERRIHLVNETMSIIRQHMNFSYFVPVFVNKRIVPYLDEVAGVK